MPKIDIVVAAKQQQCSTCQGVLSFLCAQSEAATAKCKCSAFRFVALSLNMM